MTNPTFTYDKRSQRYRYTSGSRNGQFVSQSKIHQLIERRIEDVKTDIGTITELLLDDRISLATWEETIAYALKIGHTQSYIIGRGGSPQLTQADYGRIGQQLRTQYTYLRRFSEEIAKGKLTKQQIRSRIKQYTGAFHTAYESGRTEIHRLSNARWERRVRSASESCPDCVRYESQGWVPLGTLPPPGSSSQCRVNCRCRKEYSNEFARPENDSILGNSFGWLSHKLSA